MTRTPTPLVCVLLVMIHDIGSRFLTRMPGKWLTSYAETECKPSTRRSYEQLLRVHFTPSFWLKLLTEIRRDEVKRFLADLSQVTRDIEGQPVPSSLGTPCS